MSSFDCVIRVWSVLRCGRREATFARNLFRRRSTYSVRVAAVCRYRITWSYEKTEIICLHRYQLCWRACSYLTQGWKQVYGDHTGTSGFTLPWTRKRCLPSDPLKRARTARAWRALKSNRGHYRNWNSSWIIVELSARS